MYFLGVEGPVEKGVEVAGARVLRSDVVGVELVAVAEQCDEVSLASELSDLLERVVPESEEHGVPGVAYLVVGGLDVACSSDELREVVNRLILADCRRGEKSFCKVRDARTGCARRGFYRLSRCVIERVSPEL